MHILHSERIECQILVQRDLMIKKQKNIRREARSHYCRYYYYLMNALSVFICDIVTLEFSLVSNTDYYIVLSIFGMFGVKIMCFLHMTVTFFKLYRKFQ